MQYLLLVAVIHLYIDILKEMYLGPKATRDITNKIVEVKSFVVNDSHLVQYGTEIA